MLKMSLKELVRPGACANRDANVVFMKCFREECLRVEGAGAGRSAQLKLQLEMSK